jgi:hypothetical protein
MAESKLLQLTGLWLQDGKEGQKYMAGPLGNVKVYVFKNTRKTDAKQPDYYLSLGEKPKQEKDTGS